MAETATPFDNPGPAMYEADWSALWAGTITNGVLGRSGTAAATTSLQVYTDQDGRQVKVRAGTGVIRGHFYRSDQTKVLPLAANTTFGNRIDLVVLRLDTLARTAVTAVLPGTVSGTPTALTQQVGGIWEIPLAQITVQPNFGNIAPNNILDQRPWVAPAAFAGWTAWTPTYSGYQTTGVPTQVGSLTARYKVVGDLCVASWQASMQPSGTGLGYRVSLPVAPARQFLSGSGTVQNGPAAVFTDLTGGSWAVLLKSETPNRLARRDVTVTLDGSGNGYQDFPDIPFAAYVSAFENTSDPAGGSYANSPVFSALNISGFLRLVLTEGPAGGSFDYWIVYEQLNYLNTAQAYLDNFTLAYEVAPGQ